MEMVVGNDDARSAFARRSDSPGEFVHGAQFDVDAIREGQEFREKLPPPRPIGASWLAPPSIRMADCDDERSGKAGAAFRRERFGIAGEMVHAQFQKIDVALAEAEGGIAAIPGNGPCPTIFGSSLKSLEFFIGLMFCGKFCVQQIACLVENKNSIFNSYRLPMAF